MLSAFNFKLFDEGDEHTFGFSKISIARASWLATLKADLAGKSLK